MSGEDEEREEREGSRSLRCLVMEALVEKRDAERVPRLAGALYLQLLLVMRLHLCVCQVGEMCGGGNWYGVQGGLGHRRLRPPRRTLGSHQHHRRVGRRRVVRRHHAGLHMGLLHVCHVVVVVAVLHLLRVDVDRLLGRRERCLGGLRVGPRGHGGGRGSQSRVHLLLRGLVGQVEGLGRCRRRCRLLVLLVLDWASSRVAGGTPVLRGTSLLGLARRRGRGLGMLRVRVQGGAGVGVLLRHWPRRHIHGVCLLRVLCGRGRNEARLAMRGRRHHPGAALHHRTEHMLRL